MRITTEQPIKSGYSYTILQVGKIHIVLSMTGVIDHTKWPLSLSSVVNQFTTTIQYMTEKYSKQFPTIVGHGTSELETNHFTVKALASNSAALVKSPKATSKKTKMEFQNQLLEERIPISLTLAKK